MLVLHGEVEMSQIGGRPLSNGELTISLTQIRLLAGLRSVNSATACNQRFGTFHSKSIE